jgi:replication factor A1
MIAAILRQKGMTESELLQMVEEKKQKIGAGYLTDQGALFLVAADLGVSIEEAPKLEMGLKDLYVGANEVTVIARVMNIYPLKRYSRKDGSEALLRTLTVYDNDASVKVKLWDSNANLPDTLGIKPGEAVKISKAYVKAGIDGKITLNLSSRSAVEVVQNAPQIKDLDTFSVDVSEIKGSEANAVVTGTVRESPRIANFTNMRGEPSKALHLNIAGADEKAMKVVIWNADEQRIPRVMNLNSRIRLVGVRTKRNPFGDIELHGDEGTVIELLDTQQEIEVMLLRIITASRTAKNAFALAVDNTRNVLTLTVNESFADQLKVNQLIECIPSRIYGSTVILDDDAYVRAIDDDPAFPDARTLEQKIKNVKPSQDLYFIEAVTLSAAKVQDIQMKDGTNVKYADTMLGDDTGEMKLVGWRESSAMLEKLGIGQRVKVYGVMAYVGRDGNTELRLKPFSSIMKI